MRPFALLLPVLAASLSRTQQLSNDQVNLIVSNLAGAATHSWELGTRAQALLELQAPFWSVFSSTHIPPPHSAPGPQANTVASPQPGGRGPLAANAQDTLGIAQQVVQNLTHVGAAQPLIDGDGAAGDPASLGAAVLLAGWTEQRDGGGDSARSDPDANSGQWAHLDYRAAAQGQLDYTLNVVPRASDGAISQRDAQVQFWSDGTYMMPPFLAYYGALYQNYSVLQEAYNQVKLYRKHLQDPASPDGLWLHIVEGTDGLSDLGHWSTGNGWACGGAIRVLGSIQHSSFARQMSSQSADLASWAGEIVEGMYAHAQPGGMMLNYVDQPADQTFIDGSSSAMVASCAYRLAVLAGRSDLAQKAEQTRKTIASHHIDQAGWLYPVVNPLNWSEAGSHSPEGQAFTLMMQSAWRDWVNAGSP